MSQRGPQASTVGPRYHVAPAGAFQPAALAPAHQANDFSVWRNIQDDPTRPHSRAQRELNWLPEHSELTEIIRDAWLALPPNM